MASSSSRHQAEQAQALGAVADLVAQIVGPAAEGVDVVEILMQPLGQQEADDVEILVMMRGQPARVLLGLRPWCRCSLSASAECTNSLGEQEQAGTSLGNDRRLHVTVVAHQVAHHFQQIGQRLHAVDEERAR